jgi:hypothetical protein
VILVGWASRTLHAGLRRQAAVESVMTLGRCARRIQFVKAEHCGSALPEGGKVAAQNCRGVARLSRREP